MRPKAVITDVEHQFCAVEAVPERGPVVPVGAELGAAVGLIVLGVEHVRQRLAAREAGQRLFAHPTSPDP